MFKIYFHAHKKTIFPHNQEEIILKVIRKARKPQII